jgi:hypothetical protein
MSGVPEKWQDKLLGLLHQRVTMAQIQLQWPEALLSLVLPLPAFVANRPQLQAVAAAEELSLDF